MTHTSPEKYTLVDLHQDNASFSNDTGINLAFRREDNPSLGTNVNTADPHVRDYKPMFNSDIEALRDGKVALAFANLFPLELGSDGEHRPPETFAPLFRQLHSINEALVSARPHDLYKVRSQTELETSQALARIGLVYATEGVYSADSNVLDMLWLHDIRSVGPLHNYDNEFGTTAYFDGEDLGLRPQGQSFVREADEMGFIIDGSHASPRTIKGMLDVERTRPLIVTHTTAQGIDKHSRALPDDLAKAIAQEGGIIGITPVGAFYGPKEQGNRTMARVAEHLAHLRDHLGGISALAIGTDANGGLSENSRIGSGTVDKLTSELAPELLARDFTPTDIQAVFSGNAMRYLSQHLPK